MHDVHCTGNAHASRKVQTVVIHISDHHVLGPHVLCQRRTHDSDGSRTCHKHILAYQVERECGVRGIAKRVENRGNVIADLRRQRERVACWDAEVLCKCALAVDTDPDCAPAQVPDASTAVPAVTAHHVAFAAHAVSDLKAAHALAHLYDGACKLVTNCHAVRYGLLGPLVPMVDVHVGAADGSTVNLDQHIVEARFGDGLPVHPYAGLRPQLGKGLHCGPCVD
mmetsp:Transcript_21172/g.49211  ORF Transcript_21172/g.49211 Transcript_21172/m.49211 type:complete len:224 (+) Transcript_21172:474-1145(+)